MQLIGSGLGHSMASALAGVMYRSDDVYADFGVNNAVMSSSNISEHEQNMLNLNVDARDGDDSFDIVQPEEGDEGAEEEEEEGLADPEGESSDGEEEGDGSDESDEFSPLGEPDADLKQSSAEIDEYAEGFAQMREQAVKQGLPQEVADRIEAEYEESNKLSEESLKALEKVGYSRGFVRSFINGQEALAQTYMAQIQSYAGGPAKFEQIMAHLNANSPDAASALEDAIVRQDLAGIKTIINLGMASRTKKFGKSPERSVTKRAPAVAARSAPKGPAGFESQRDMIKAMSDPRYSTDAKYRSDVEARVSRSSW